MTLVTSMLQMVVHVVLNSHECSCMGSHGCFAYNNKQCRFDSLATSTIASTCMTHVLLLLWDETKAK